MKRAALPRALQSRLRRVKLFLCDVDGVLTDATVSMGAKAETKRFNIRDGLGLRLLQKEAGLRVGWVSARPSTATAERARDLKLDFLHQSPENKVTAIEGILRRCELSWDELAWMGDDLLDLGALRRARFSAVPADALPEAAALAHYVCRASGGQGAVREVVELILRAQGHWERLIEKFSS